MKTSLSIAAENRENAEQLLSCPAWRWYAHHMKERQDRIMQQIFADDPHDYEMEVLARRVVQWREIDNAIRWPQRALDEAIRNANEAGRQQPNATTL